MQKRSVHFEAADSTVFLKWNVDIRVVVGMNVLLFRSGRELSVLGDGLLCFLRLYFFPPLFTVSLHLFQSGGRP